MKKAMVEKAVCKSCGADVREGTQFCYNCGKSVAEDKAADAVDPEKTSGDLVDEEIAKQFRIDEEPSADKLAVAAAKRKKSRAGLRKPSEMVWEPADSRSSVLFFIVTIIITMIAAAVVFLAVYLK